MVGCSDDQTQEQVQSNDETNESEPTQEELNNQLKEEASEADFVKLNNGEIEEGTKLKVSGEITLMESNNDFTLTSKENDGYGMYSILNFDTTESTVEEGDDVTVYGTYTGDSETGMPEIRITVIE